MPATKPSFPPVLGSFSGCVRLSRLLPTGAGSGWTHHPSLPLEVIVMSTVPLFSHGDLVLGSC